jgi:hypothetical protein
LNVLERGKSCVGTAFSMVYGMPCSFRDYSSPLHVSRYRFIDSTKKKNGRFNRSYASGGGVRRLWEELSYPFDHYHYSLKHHHLGIDKEFAASFLINDHLAIKAWKIVIRELFEPPYFYKFEVGKLNNRGALGLLHVHLIADVDAGLLHLPRTSSTASFPMSRPRSSNSARAGSISSSTFL